uniref:Piwi-like protein 1 n=1 Tax=Aceria tosichella TaxID=561515 RepID=A0A6G1S4P7_9ACAR
MSSRGSPPSKQARAGEEQERQAAAASTPTASSSSGAGAGTAGESPEERSRRIAARRPSDEARRPLGHGTISASDDIIVVDEPAATSSGRPGEAGGSGQRGRGGYHAEARPREPRREIVTCPENVVSTCVQDQSKFRMVDVMANFIRVEPMKERHIWQYRVEFEPNVESRPARRLLFKEGTENVFSKRPGFDGMHDVYCSQKLAEKVTTMNVEHPLEKGLNIEMKIICVREVDWTSFEMMRCYNMHMKKFLHLLEFYQITATGSWVHSDLATPIGDGKMLSMIRGYRTATNTYDGNKILVNLESVHKLMQRRNVFQIMASIREQKPANLREALKSELIGKLVITNYNKRIYRIEDIRFDLKPTDTFTDKRDSREISYLEYFKTRHNEVILEVTQPMLQVVPNNKRGRNERGNEDQTREILLVPELCNITGLTEQQRNDNRLKMDLIRSSQVAPADRVSQLRAFLGKFHANVEICNLLKEWGYSYDNDPVKMKTHVLPVTKIGFKPDKAAFNPVNPNTADFNVNDLARIPQLDNLVVITTRIDLANKQTIMGNLKRGFDKVRLRPVNVKQIDIKEGDAPSHYIGALRSLPQETTACVVVMHNQNKERYDSIKKIATVERGLITQVVTAKLMLDPKKITGACVKIAIQIAAKIGGEPWWADIPLKRSMICGYDTFRDTAKRGLNYGAFLASMNDQYSRWYSKADAHDQADQISIQLADAYTDSLKKYKELNGNYPDRVFIYRDGAGEGQLATIYDTELVKLREAVKKVDENIRMTMIIVNKRTGARFYMRNNNTFTNPPPGTAIDRTVTRQGRFDFYLISQSTRNGTVAPTYYNIIHDESNMAPELHQMLAFKLSLMYYNWSGTVRVPAPCQYAHKLAALCGEHLHSQPNASLNDRLHFL